MERAQTMINPAPRPNSPRPALTSAPSYDLVEDSVQTDKVGFSEVKKPKEFSSIMEKGQTVDELGRTVDESLENRPNEEFSFEKNTIRVMGESKLAVLQCDGPDADVDITNPHIRSLRDERRQSLEDEKEDVQTWDLAITILVVGMICFAVVNGIFSLVYIFVLSTNANVNIAKNTATMVVNIAAGVWILGLAIRGRRLSRCRLSSDGLFTSYFKLSVLSLVLFLIQLALMSNLESIPALFERTRDMYISENANNSDQRKADAYVGLGYLVVWADCIFNLAVVGLGAMFAYLLRRHLRLKEMYELEQKALPLGYQIYDKLRVEQKDSSVCKEYHV